MKRTVLSFASLTAMILIITGCASSDKKVGVFDNVDEYDARLYSLPTQNIAPVAAPQVVAQESAKGLFDTTSLVTFPDTQNVSEPAPQTQAHTQRSIASVEPVVTTFAPSSHEVLNADQAYAALIRGNERFIQGTLDHRNQNEARRRAIAQEQRPFAVVLSSSDSRVPPELIFDQGLGDLYVIRVGGGVLGSAQVAAIEYAIGNLGAKLILVLGNESSAEIQKALKVGSLTESTTEQTTDQKWLASEIKNNLKNGRFPAGFTEDPKLREAAKANVDSVTGLLYVRSSLVKNKIQSGEVKLVRGVYGVDTGKVEFWKFGEVPAKH
jgi:carbonic anhydrase